MKEKEFFESKLDEATAIRTHIQDDLRASYNELKFMFELFTGHKGKVLKHVVDMYHYRNGGYPQPNSQPKHLELIERFAWMVHWFDLVGFSHQYKEVLGKYGITITVEPIEFEPDDEQGEGAILNYPIPNPDVTGENLDELKENELLSAFLPKKEKVKFSQAIRAFVYACDKLQGEICANSNTIKREIAEEIQETCDIKKGDFTSSVVVNYHRTSGKATKKKVKKLEQNLKSKVQTGKYNIDNLKQELDEDDDTE